MAIKVAVSSRLGGEGKTTLSIILTQIALMKNKTVLAFDLNGKTSFNFNTSVAYLKDEPKFKGKFTLKTVLTKEDFDSNADWIIIDCPSIISSDRLNESTRLALQNSDFILALVWPGIFSMDSETDLFSLMNDFPLILRRAAGYKEIFQFPLVKIGFVGNPTEAKFANAIIKYQYSQYPVIGDLPRYKTIPANISPDRKKWWSVGLQAHARQPFELIYTRLELLYRKLQALHK